ncbi:MAG: tetratricopeptide repeat protein [Chloroflexi bacterium]|nr:tetratricopeptide repeat protein [Chloroflexota bacterium]
MVQSLRIFFDSLTQRIGAVSTPDLQRAVWVVLITLVASLTAFSGYYYWDRYVHLGDKSPLERDIEHMEQVIQENPQDSDARVALAEYYLNEGAYQKSLDQATQVLALYPEHEGALLLSGIAYIRLGQPEAAVDPLEKFVALRRDRPMADADVVLEAAYYFLGTSYIQLNRLGEAISALEAALAINPTDADALYQLGLAYHANGQPEAALERYHKAVRFVPDFADAYQGMAESYSALDQSDYVAYARGMHALSSQDYETAQTHLKYATQALPDFAPAFLGLGLMYEQMGELDQALTAVQRALKLDHNNFVAQQALGRIQAAMGVQD